MGSLALRPDDSLAILTMALSIGFRNSVAFLSAIQATGLLTFAPVGLPPTEHASLHWTHPSARIAMPPPKMTRQPPITMPTVDRAIISGPENIASSDVPRFEPGS